MTDRAWMALELLAWGLAASATYAFVPWSELGPGWSQTVGSFAALAVAVYVMARQNRHATKLLIQADVLAARRRAAGVHAIVNRAITQARRVDEEVRLAIRSFTDADGLAYRLRVLHGVIDPTRSTLLTIPTHELGSYEMAEAVHDLSDVIGNLHFLLERGIARPRGFEQDPGVIEVLDLGMDAINESEAKFLLGLRALK